MTAIKHKNVPIKEAGWGVEWEFGNLGTLVAGWGGEDGGGGEDFNNIVGRTGARTLYVETSIINNFVNCGS